jgi:Peptidase inhibitor family I36
MSPIRRVGATLAPLCCVCLFAFATSATAHTTLPPLGPSSNGGVEHDTLGSGSCKSSTFCMWQDSSEKGSLYYYPISEYAQDKELYVGSYANDKASSIYNDRVHETIVQENFNVLGGEAVIGAGKKYENLAGNAYPNNGVNMNDSISAIWLLE